MSRELRQIVTELVDHRLSRREFIGRASALGLSMGVISSILAACGGGAATPAATQTSTATATTAAAATETTGTTPSATETPTEAAASETPSGPKILRIAIFWDMTNLDPAFRTGAIEHWIMDPILSGLVTYGPNTYEPVNDLAEKIETSKDGLVTTFKLREGVKWHNGYGEVTTEDVKFSFERMIDPNLKATYKDDWATLDHVEVIDKYNGKIIFKESFAPLWRTTLPAPSGMIVCKKQVQEVGDKEFATMPVGSGPYFFAEWKPKEKVILKKNPDYFGKTPVWDEIHFIPIEDDKTAEIALEAGELDFCRISLASLDRIQADSRFAVQRNPSDQYYWIGMNVENPKLQDINIRQAIRYAIDVPSILQAAYLGKSDQATAAIPPGFLGHWKDAPKYQRDLAKAKEYMAKAGVQSLDLKYDSLDSTEYRTWGEIAQQNLAEIGINLSVAPSDSATFWVLNEGDKGKDLELFGMRYGALSDPAWVTMWFTCDQLTGWNWMHWCNNEYDELHKKALTTLDDKEREQMYVRMQQLWDDNCNSVWIHWGTRDYAYVNGIKAAMTPHGMVQPKYFEPA